MVQTKYITFDWYKKGADAALDFLQEELEGPEQYNFFKFLMEQYPNLDIDWLETFEDLREPLFKENRIDEVLAFVDWYSQIFPKKYGKKYEFIERDLLDYYIFKNDWENVRKRIAIIEKNPAAGIDTITIRLLYQLIFNGQTGMAVEYSKSVWQPIAKSKKVVGFAAYPFINTIYIERLHEYYQAWLKNEPSDEKAIFEESVTMGFDGDPDLFNLVIDSLKTELDIPKVIQSIESKDDEHMLVLNVHFLKFMLHHFHLPFVFSDWMWNFIATVEIFGKQNGAENWFYIDGKTMDKHISDKYDHFLASNKLEILGKVWGLEYVFYFLNQVQLLSDQHFQVMMENITYFRNGFTKMAFPDLWQLSFVHDWPRTDNCLKDPSDRKFFESTRHISNSGTDKVLENYFLTYTEPDWVLEEQNKRRPQRQPLREESMPYVKPSPDIGRNDPCPCGSGKKYKKCCMN